MERIDLSGTDKTPSVVFDPQQGLIELRGCSIHENADRFFRPLLEQVENYTRHPAPQTLVRFSLTYFNSSSAKYILDLLKILDDMYAAGTGKVMVEWHYDEGDLDIEEAGEDYKGLVEMPVKLVRN